MEALEEVTWPRPLAELLEAAFTPDVKANPWVGDLEISPKSVVREMVEIGFRVEAVGLAAIGINRGEVGLPFLVTHIHRTGSIPVLGTSS